MITFLIELIILLFRFEILSTGDTSIPPLPQLDIPTDQSSSLLADINPPQGKLVHLPVMLCAQKL